MFHTLISLIMSFGKIGIFALGGGASMIKLIENECVTLKGWLTGGEFSTLTGITFLFPGLTGIKIAGLIGYKVAGFPGLLASTLALNIPGLFLTIGFTRFVMIFHEKLLIKKMIVGVQYGAVALLGAAVCAVAQPLFETSFSKLGTVLMLSLLGAVVFFDLSPFLGMMLVTLIYVILSE